MKSLRWFPWPLLALLLCFCTQAVATVPVVTPEISYTATGAATDYAFPFRIFAATDLTVTVNDVVQTLNTDYTVTGVDVPAGGTVVFTTPPADTLAVLIERLTPLDRQVDYTTGGPLRATTLNRDLDRIVTQVQDVSRQANANTDAAGRSIKFPAGDSAVSVLPDVATRASKVLGFDVAGGVVPVDVVGDLSGYALSYTPLADALARYDSAGVVQGTNIVHRVETIAALRLITGSPGRMAVQVMGYYAPGDGGGGPVRHWASGKAVGYYTAVTGTEPENGGSIIVPTGGDGSAAWLWEWNGPIPVVWFGADPTGVIDSTVAINAAHTLAGLIGSHDRAKSIVKLGAGQFKVSTPLIYKAPMRGDGLQVSQLLTTEDAGGNVILVNDIDYFDLRDFKITSYDNTLNNFIGIKATQDVAGYGNHWFLENLLVEKAAVGISIRGWIGTAIRTKVRYCTLGFYGEQLNASFLDITNEGNTVGIQINGAGGLQLFGVHENNDTAVVLDSVGNLSINAYFELNDMGIQIGRTIACKNINWVSGSMSAVTPGSVGVDAYNVAGFKVGTGTTIAYNSPVIVGALSTDVDLSGVRKVVDPVYLDHLQNVFYADKSSAPKKVLNLFPNPDFLGGLRGWKGVINYSGAGTGGVSALSHETTNTLTGGGLRVDMPAATYQQWVSMQIPDSVLPLLLGKTVKFSAWVYVGDTVDFYPNGATFPAIKITVTGGTTPGSSLNGSVKPRAGVWSEITGQVAVGADATAAYIYLYTTQTAITTVPNHVILGKVVLYTGEHTFEEVHNRVEIHPAIGRYLGENWQGFVSSFAAIGTGQTYKIGDEFVNATPTVIGTGGYVTTNQKYIVQGWKRITAGTANVLNTDWVEERVLTGQ